MDKMITFIFPGGKSALRLNKIASFLCKNGFKTSFIGWPRSEDEALKENKLFESSEYVLVGGGAANSKLPFLYIVFIFKLFLKLLFRKGISDTTLFCINFESAFSVWMVSKFRNVKYVYDIWDELALSHKFPTIVVRLLNFFDRKMRRDSVAYIHVDLNRFSKIDENLNNSVVLYNSPLDFFNGVNPAHQFKKTFAVTGWLNKTRGLQSIYTFALNHPEATFIVAGEFLQKEMEVKFKSLSNVVCYDFMSQDKLFALIQDCSGIFSLYDTSIPINKLAASNKLYDAMMLGIPVIVNEGLNVVDYVKTNNIGFVVNYQIDKSWDKIVEADVANIEQMGENGRRLYLENFEFDNLCKKTILPIINQM